MVVGGGGGYLITFPKGMQKMNKNPDKLNALPSRPVMFVLGGKKRHWVSLKSQRML